MKIAVVSDGETSSATYVLNGLAKHSKHKWNITQYTPDLDDCDMVYVHPGVLFSDSSPQLRDLFLERRDLKWAVGIRGELNYKKWAVDWNPTTKVRDWVHLFDAISCSNSHYLEEMNKFGFNVHFCPSGTDSTIFHVQSYPDKFTIGFVGATDHGEKNYSLFDSLPFNKKIADSSVSYENMSDYYKDISVLVCCSHHEGSPVPPKEAAFCGKPTVAFPVGDISDWLPENLIVNDRESMIKILREMESDPALVATNGLLCNTRVQRYDFVNVAPLYDRMLESCFR